MPGEVKAEEEDTGQGGQVLETADGMVLNKGHQELIGAGDSGANTDDLARAELVIGAGHMAPGAVDAALPTVLIDDLMDFDIAPDYRSISVSGVFFFDHYRGGVELVPGVAEVHTSHQQQRRNAK